MALNLKLNSSFCSFAEFTSIRSGLRKRKRAESPQKTETQVSEEWVDEDKLKLWEIKLFGEKYVSTSPHTELDI